MLMTSSSADAKYSQHSSTMPYTYTPEQPFDVSDLLDYYQNKAGAAVCTYIVEHSGLGDADFGGAEYRLEPRGIVELPNFFERTVQLVRVDGVLADTGETVRVYFHSWEELCQGFLDGYSAWRLSDGRNANALASVQQRADIYWDLHARPDGPYHLPWNMKLPLERKDPEYSA